MTLIKCKMCGGDLNLVEGASTAECVFCGSVQTVPKVDDEKKLTLFARANRLRAACEFDKAAGIYEAIVADFPEEAEAYWGLVLCKYGIEYVDDPATGKKIPTCHRSSFDSVLEGNDFEQVLENADFLAREVYREEANAIENLRKGIWGETMKRLLPAQFLLSASLSHTVAVKSDGTVVAKGNNNWHQCDVSKWKNIVAIATSVWHTVGLKSDGTVVAKGNNTQQQCDVFGWKDIVAIAANSYHTVGLKSDGTVVATGGNDCGQCDVSGWENIIAVAAGHSHTVGLKCDGTVVATGDNVCGQCDVSGWKDIVAISAFDDTIGLKSDGTIVITGLYEDHACEAGDNNIAVSSGSPTFSVKADGTVIAFGSIEEFENVTEWKDIIAIHANTFHVVGLKSDGTVVALGRNDSEQCCVNDWKLFDNLQDITDAQQRRKAGLCQHCGGELKGLFSKKCVSCGKPKDY